MVYHIPALEWAPDDEMDEAEMGEELQQQAGIFSEDDMATTAMQSSTPAITLANTQAADLAAIPKASTPSRKRSKRRAGSADEHSMDRAERMKAAKNLDAPLKQGNNPTEQSFINFTSEQISHDLDNLGFCLGQDTESISASVTAYKPRSGEDE
jgi:hypothetical protein